jgi:hypothetical protein
VGPEARQIGLRNDPKSAGEVLILPGLTELAEGPSRRAFHRFDCSKWLKWAELRRVGPHRFCGTTHDKSMRQALTVC